MFQNDFSKTLAGRIVSFVLAFVFITTSTITPAVAQVLPTVLNLPVPGTMVMPSQAYHPALIKGITIDPKNPLRMDFIVDRGDEPLSGKARQEQIAKLVKYFLAALTTPEDKLWVNLSPYEKDRIIPATFGDTTMGRDLLAQDYLLKQLTSSLMYPDNDSGRAFWQRVRQKAYQKFGTTDVPMNTFNKIWIVPEKAVIYTHGNNAFVVSAKLKVMLEEDYLALNAHRVALKNNASKADDTLSGVSLKVVREVLIPEIEKEVNEGKNFAPLRQIYASSILANWYKKNLKESLLGQAYVDRGKTAGIATQDKEVNQKIWKQYVESFKKGVYNYIKEEKDPATGGMIPRKYFSGGANLKGDFAMVDSAQLTPAEQKVFARPYDRAMVDLAPTGKSDAGMLSAEALATLAEIQKRNPYVAAFIRKRAIELDARDIELVNESDRGRLTKEAIQTGVIKDFSNGPLGAGTYIGSSHPEDVARAVARTFVATDNPADKGKFNNYQDSKTIKTKIEPLFKNALKGTGKL